MLVVVLFTLLLLAGILAATVRLSLGSRQNTADQAATLRAQYAAESQLSLVKSQLRDYQLLLSPSRPGPDGTTIDQMSVPPSVTKEELLEYAEEYCNKSGLSNAWSDANEFKTARTDLDKDVFTDPKECIVDPTITNADQYDVLAKFVTPVAYNVLPSIERPSDVNSEASRLTWWTTLLNNEKSNSNSKFNIRAIRVVKLTPTRYRFFVGVKDAKARGTSSNATRVLAAKRTTNGDWWFEIVLPSLLDDVLMTNHHRAKPAVNVDGSYRNYAPDGAPGVNFTDQIFDGSVHTNEKFLFDGSSSAQFKDKVSSVGCIDLPGDGRPASGNCQKTAGVYIEGDPKTPPDSQDTDELRNKWIADEVAKRPDRTVSFVKQATDNTKIDYTRTVFTAAYKPLPDNENDQKTAAATNGISLGSQPFDITLKAANANGVSPTSYTNQKWSETTGNIYQYITIKRYLTRIESVCTYGAWQYVNRTTYNSVTDNNLKQSFTFLGTTYYQIRSRTCADKAVETGVTATDEYRYGPDKKLYLKSPTGTWSNATLVKENFNGVIYGDSIKSVSGPARTDDVDPGDLGKIPPALASFAGITLAATGNIRIDSDLTMSETPCTFAETKANPPCTRKPNNILGIYSQSGDIVFTANTKRNLNIHAAIIASTGEVTVENFKTRPQNGNVNLIGSLIENWYGAFGQYGSSNTGYGRNFTYDYRLRSGITPPFFPVSPRWDIIAASSVSSKKLNDLVLNQSVTSSY